MKRYAITVAYDGTDYEGWQMQTQGLTIAGVLQDTFHKLFSRSIKLKGASRTDAGVHAQGQVACFMADLSVSAETMLRVWNKHLPQDILIKDLKECADDFNPRHGVKQKIYQYHFFLTFPNPLTARFGYRFPYKLDLEKFSKCLQLFVGRHDFRSFSTGEYENTVRVIDAITLSFDECFQAYKIEISGRSFLRYMIRRIVGACLKVASSDIPVEFLKEALEKRDPRQLLPTAPAKGLLLYSIRY